MNDLPETLTLDEVAQVFRVSEVTIHRWLKKSREGKSRFPLPLGSKYQHLRFNRDSILHYFRHGETSSPVANQSDRHKDAMSKLRARGVAKPDSVSTLARHGIELKCFQE